MTTLAIMQPYLFPYLGYFQLIHAADRFVFYDNVTFIKGGWINRNRILGRDGAAYFTIPLDAPSSHKLICETEVNRREYDAFATKFVKTLHQGYARAPHVDAVTALVERVLASDAPTIAELAASSVEAVADALELDVEFCRSSECHNNRELTGADRVLDICLRERADRYVNLPGGRVLYNADLFAREDIELRFIEGRAVQYEQFGAQFVPDLSIIDVLMFNGIAGTRELAARYTLG